MADPIVEIVKPVVKHIDEIVKPYIDPKDTIIEELRKQNDQLLKEVKGSKVDDKKVKVVEINNLY